VLNFALPKNRNLLSHPTFELSHENEPSIGANFIDLQSVDSTNNYAMAKVHEGMAFHGTVYFAFHQSAGRGQRGKSWESRPGENITMSVILEPVFLDAGQQFLLSATVAIACIDYLQSRIEGNWKIKWPNDLYWDDRKAGGILIENKFKGDRWLFAVAGIGININQVDFAAGIGNPVSLSIITQKKYSSRSEAIALCKCLEKRFSELKLAKTGDIVDRYNELLFRRNEQVRLKKKDKMLNCRLAGVNEKGQLIVVDGESNIINPGEVEWII